MASDGSLIHHELKGPSTIEAWLKSWAVFRSAMIMINAVDISDLDGYAALIKRYSDRYGAATWGLLYQADHRARLEQLERIRRRGAREYEIVKRRTQDGDVLHEFVPTRPWPWCFAQLAADTAWWQDQFVEDAILVRAKIDSDAKKLDGDAEIEMPSGSVSRSAPTQRAPPAAQRGERTPTKASKQDRQHFVAGDKYTHNRSGLALCPGFNDGTCTATAKGKGGFVCAKNANMVHQCTACLSQDHGASSPLCRGSTTAKMSDSPRFKGGGRSRGKGGGKKGKK